MRSFESKRAKIVDDYYKIINFEELNDFVRANSTDLNLFSSVIGEVCGIGDTDAIPDEGICEPEEVQFLQAMAKAYNRLGLIVSQNIKEESANVYSIERGEDDGYEANASDILDSWPIVERYRESLGYDNFPEQDIRIIGFTKDTSLKDAVVITSSLCLKDRKSYVGIFVSKDGKKIFISPNRFLKRDIDKEPEFDKMDIETILKGTEEELIDQTKREYSALATIDGKKKIVKRLVLGNELDSDNNLMAWLYGSENIDIETIAKNPELSIIDKYITAYTLVKGFRNNIKTNLSGEFYCEGSNEEGFDYGSLYANVVEAGNRLRRAKMKEIENGLASPDEEKQVYPIKFAKDVSFDVAKLITIMQYILHDDGLIVGEFTCPDGGTVTINPIRLLLRGKDETVGEIDIETLRSEQEEANKGQGLYHVYPIA